MSAEMTETNERSEARGRLAESLTRRVPTWQVASDIIALNVVESGSDVHRELIELAGESRYGWYGAMNDDFDRVDPVDTQLDTYGQLFPEIDRAELLLETLYGSDGNYLTALVRAALDRLGAGEFETAAEALQAFSGADNRETRQRIVNDLGANKTLKRLRFLRRFEQKIARYEDVLRLRRAQMQAKSRLAYMVSPDACDDLTLAFVAYLAARANRRSIFMLGSQSRAQDTISAGLEKLLESDSQANWGQIALVKPTKNVISRLDPRERGVLVGIFHAAMADAADALEGLYSHLPERMRAEMVMVKGVDSSRWNAYAGALNTMRSAWISAVLASSLAEILDSYLPGKAPRLMASDLVWWYRNSGQELHEDTRMFGALPHPWLVVSGQAQQGRQDVLDVAKELNVDALTSGWVGPRTVIELERPEAEPALVHGIVVSDPALARTLRRCGVFSGKQLKNMDELPATVERGYLIDVERDRVAPVVMPSSTPAGVERD